MKTILKKSKNDCSNNSQAKQHWPLLSALVVCCCLMPDKASALEYGLLGNLTARENSESDYSSNPFLASLDLYTAHRFDERFSALFEFVAERTKDHTHHHTERLSATYRFVDLFELSAGRFHTPLGYWNRKFHHGRLLHDTAERPFFMEFEHQPSTSWVLPAHLVGFMASGKHETARQKHQGAHCHHPDY